MGLRGVRRGGGAARGAGGVVFYNKRKSYDAIGNYF